MMSYFENTIIWLDSIGITDVFVPFFLVFALVFAILQKTHILGDPDKRKNLNVVVALIMGLAVVIPHVTGNYPMGYDVVEIINNALPHVSLVIVAIVMILLLIGLFGGEASWVGSTASGIVAVLAFIVVIYIFGSAAGFWRDVWWLGWLRDPEVQALIIVLLVFGLIVWFITKEERKTPGEGLFKSFGEFFKKH